jgi:3-dehydroquinate dehydratase/shikimate dehydrogenase
MSRLCVPIFVHSLDQARRDIARAIEAGADLIELRLDHVADVSVAIELQDAFPQSTFILTKRAARQGGDCEDSDADRLPWLLHARGDRANWVDIEADSEPNVLKYAFAEQGADRRTILSQHDFKTRPTDLTKKFVAMQESPASVAKVAWQARSLRDNIEAFELMLAGPKPAIAICMGEAGQISRILAKKFGAFLSFASLEDRSATAPGQVRIADLKSTYRWDKQTRDTKVYGVVGSPVGHSMSPAVHNAGFDAIGFDGVYVPLLVEPSYASFKAFMESFLAFEPLHLSGLSITIPHKENALAYAKEKGFNVDPLAERIGAVNTYRLETGKPSVAVSTDYAAILDTITSGLGIDREGLSGLRVAVVGAGGTGRTAVAALAHFGANVTILNRTKKRAEELAEELHGKIGTVVALPLNQLTGGEFDVVVNATSLGMSPEVEGSIFDDSVPRLSSQTLVFDTVYNPMETKLLRQAKEAGAKIASGVDMFVRQAIGQFELWTEKPAPTELMRQVIVERLSRAK